MAYISQEMKKELAPGIKAVFKKYGLKGSIAIRHHMRLEVTIRSGDIDFISIVNDRNIEKAERKGLTYKPIYGYHQAYPYYSDQHENDQNCIMEKCLNELRDAMRGTLWYDNSDSMTDYFDTAYYMTINIGRCGSPYQYTGA